jgi:hypothetical protein
METISVKNSYDDEILRILRDKRYANIPFIDRGLVSIDNIPTSSLLFMGINPSFTGGASPNELHYYNLVPGNNDYKKYFGRFEEIANHTGLPWGHLDLLYFRETDQNKIEEIMEIPEGISFTWQQLEVSKKILESVKPKILIVCNTKARQFLGKDKSGGNNIWLGYDFKWDKGIGTYRVTNTDSVLCNTPVFFSGMLTGQRALDVGSYERLNWHIKWVLENKF